MKKVIPFSSERDQSRALSSQAAKANASLARELNALTDGPEQQLLLMQRLLGATDRREILSSFYAWTRDLSFADGIRYTCPKGQNNESLGEKRHHSAQYRLTLDGTELGTITLCRRERYSENELFAIERALGALARCLRSAEEVRQLKELVTQDSLTGLGNRKALQQGVTQELARTRRHRTPLAVMMIDVDHFKELNDSLGHLGGDKILRAIADVFKRSTRRSDLLFRYGGDEFTILLPHTDYTGAEDAARKIRSNLALLSAAELGIKDEENSVRPDVSIGIACHQAGDDEYTLMQRADTHLYHAKAQGRGRVCSNV